MSNGFIFFMIKWEGDPDAKNGDNYKIVIWWNISKVADKSIIRVFSLPKLFLNDKLYNYTQKKTIWHLAILQNWCFGQFYHSKICNIEKFTFFSVLLVRRLRVFILQKVQVSVVERQKKKFCYPSLNFGKEDTHMILLSAWDRSRDSTAKRNLSKDM